MKKTNLIIFIDGRFNLSDKFYGVIYDEDENPIFSDNVANVVQDYSATADMLEFPQAFKVSDSADGLVRNSKNLDELKTHRIAETIKEKSRQVEDIVSKHIETTCQDKGYDNENSIAKYTVTEVNNPFYKEAVALATWITACWVVLIAEQKKNTITADTVVDEAEVIKLLPEYK